MPSLQVRINLATFDFKYILIGMKTIKYLFVLFCFTVLLAGCSSGPEAAPASSDSSTVTDYTLSELELEIIQEINFARTEPKKYVTQRLSIVDTSKKSESYIAALDEVVDKMSRMNAPLPALTTADGLNKCAKEWVNISGPVSYVGHESNMAKRFQKYCTYMSLGENCSYGYSTAIDIVREFLIDDGVETRGHRNNILSSAFTHVGTATGTHKKYKTMCCVEFARNYKEK